MTLFALTIALTILLLLVLGTAPTPSARSDPGGIKLDDGYRTLVAIASDLNIEFWEQTVKPPGMDGAEEINTTTMHNDVWRTFSPRALVTMTPMELAAAYDPIIYTSLLAILNDPTTVTVHFPDGSTLCFYAFVRNAEPNTLEEGTFPLLTITIVPTNQDPTSGDEEAPVLDEATGT